MLAFVLTTASRRSPPFATRCVLRFVMAETFGTADGESAQHVSGGIRKRDAGNARHGAKPIRRRGAMPRPHTGWL
jgi:hypothetical protein